MARSPVPRFLGRSAVSPRASTSPRALPVASAASRPSAGPGGPPGAAHPRGRAATQSSALASSGGRLKPGCRLRPARCRLRPRGPPEARPLRECWGAPENPETRIRRSAPTRAAQTQGPWPPKQTALLFLTVVPRDYVTGSSSSGEAPSLSFTHSFNCLLSV